MMNDGLAARRRPANFSVPLPPLSHYYPLVAERFDTDALVGQVLHDTYRVRRRMAEGGMGVVYEAVHARLARKRFAIKVLHRAAARMPDVYERFRREAEIATELGHPNIVDVLDFYHTEDGQPYLVMEYLEGEDLACRLARVGRLEPEVEALYYCQFGCTSGFKCPGGLVCDAGICKPPPGADPPTE